jgi:hypothetical protein
MSDPPSVADRVAPDAPEIEVVATRALRRVQESFSTVLTAVPGRTARAHEIEKSLGLHKTLAWKIAQITEADDPVTIYQRLPGAAAINKVLEAAARRGVDRRDLDTVRDRVAEVGRIVTEHAGDAETFVMMLSGFGARHQPETDLYYRKQAFQSTSYLCGVQAETILRSVVVNGGEGDMLDATVIFGCRDLIRLRADRGWTINRWRPTDDEGKPIPIVRKPKGETANGSPPLILQRGPAGQRILRRSITDDEIIEDEIAPGPVGRSGAVTFYTGEVLRGVMSRYRVETSHQLAQNLEVRTPCRAIIFDHLVHKDLFGRVEPELRVFGELAGRPLWSNVRSDRDRLSVFESVEYRGRGLDVLPAAEAPEYADLVGRLGADVGWALEEFDVYRLRMAYPYVPTTITYSYPLPEKT